MFHQVDRAATSGRVYPQLRVQGRRTDSGVEVFGLTDLPDGTILRYEVAAPGRHFGLFGSHRRRGETRVSGGRYAIVFEPSPWNGRELKAAISLRADASQPAATQGLLGRHGERLAGDVSGDDYSEYFVTDRLRL